MDIKILPYIDTTTKTTASSASVATTATDNSAANQASSKTVSEALSDFNSVLKDVTATLNKNNQDSTSASSNADTTALVRAAASLIVDKIVSASASNSIDAKAMQDYFDAHGINIKLSNISNGSTGATSADSNSAAASTSASSQSFAAVGTDDDSSTASSSTVSGASDDTYGSTSSTSSATEAADYTGGLSCSDELNKIFDEASSTYGVNVKLLKSIAKCESNFKASAVSSSGAVGIMQLMPSTASGLGVTDSYDEYQNIMGGAKYIAQLLAKYDGDTSLALAAYNAGPGNVDKYGGIPPFNETQNYVTKVLTYYKS